jgi:hypothetical protein
MAALDALLSRQVGEGSCFVIGGPVFSMQSFHRIALRLATLSLTCVALAAVTGCSIGSSVSWPDIDPQAASSFAVELYDANGDGTFETAELSKCPPLLAARASFDTDADGRLSAKEVTDGLTLMFVPETSLTEMTCTVTLNRRPLTGATVRLRPAEMLGNALPPAEGVTDQDGRALPTIDAELLPEESKQRPLVYSGLYRVEITHPQTELAARFNTASELGCMINPAARNGTSARFNVK